MGILPSACNPRESGQGKNRPVFLVSGRKYRRMDELSKYFQNTHYFFRFVTERLIPARVSKLSGVIISMGISIM
jgi:hypothetical protein